MQLHFILAPALVDNKVIQLVNAVPIMPLRELHKLIKHLALSILVPALICYSHIDKSVVCLSTQLGSDVEYPHKDDAPKQVVDVQLLLILLVCKKGK